jgi:hypothetical protein
MKPAWTRSTREEAICALWTIAALLARSQGMTVLSYALGWWAVMGAICTIATAIVDNRKEPTP